MTLEIVLKSIFGSDLERLTRQMGVNPFDVVAKQSNRDLRFAFQFRSLGKLVGELIQQRRHAPHEHFDFLGMFMMTRDRETDEPMSDKELIDEVIETLMRGMAALLDQDRKSTRLNSSHQIISYAVFCLK